MVESKERTLHERETLLFPTREEAQAWTEKVAEQAAATARPGVRRDREVVAEAVAQEFEKHGEAVSGSLARPWEHSAVEHAEVQQLVDTAFAKDLGAALRAARGSDAYPRNIDLLHDVLTTEMYEAMRTHHLNRQPMKVGLIVTIGVLMLVGVAVIWVMML